MNSRRMRLDGLDNLHRIKSSPAQPNLIIWLHVVKIMPCMCFRTRLRAVLWATLTTPRCILFLNTRESTTKHPSDKQLWWVVPLPRAAPSTLVLRHAMPLRQKPLTPPQTVLRLGAGCHISSLLATNA
jgi:hypothetical protein